MAISKQYLKVVGTEEKDIQALGEIGDNYRGGSTLVEIRRGPKDISEKKGQQCSHYQK